MKYWKTKAFILGMAVVLLVLLLSLFETPTMAVGTNWLHFDPDESSASCGQNVEIVLVADIDEQNPVIATMIYFTFDKNCLEITNAVGNTADWPGGVTMQDLDWVNENGGVMITTNVGLNPGLTGSVPIATLTLRGKNCAGCTSSLHLAQGEYTTWSMETIYPELDDGTFTTIATATPTATPTTIPTPTLLPTLTPTTTPALTPTPTLTPTLTPTTTPNPTPTSIPTLTPMPPSSPAAGLSAGAWTGIGLAILLFIALGIWLIMRRRS